MTDRGAVEVDEYLRTSQPHIYALSDVNGGPQHTYISLDDSRIVMDQLVGEGRRSTADRVAIPHTVFMTPPLGTIGLTEEQARAAGYRIKVASEPVADIIAMPRAEAVEETRGFMKFVINAETDEIFGAALLSIDAQELINIVALAMRHGITATDLRDGIDTHPGSTEALNEVLGTIVRADEPLAALSTTGAVLKQVSCTLRRDWRDRWQRKETNHHEFPSQVASQSRPPDRTGVRHALRDDRPVGRQNLGRMRSQNRYGLRLRSAMLRVCSNSSGC